MPVAGVLRVRRRNERLGKGAIQRKKEVTKETNKRRRMFWALIFMGLAVAIVPSVLDAHSGASGAVMERMEVMALNNDAFETIKAMMTGETPYDANQVKTHARSIADSSGEALTKFFPTDSLDDSSQALPAIWEDWETFGALSQELQNRAIALEAAADSGPAPQVFEELSATCDSCHLKFRK